MDPCAGPATSWELSWSMSFGPNTGGMVCVSQWFKPFNEPTRPASSAAAMATAFASSNYTPTITVVAPFVPQQQAEVQRLFGGAHPSRAPFAVAPILPPAFYHGSTWNPSDTDAAITLSAANYIATTISTAQTGVRGVQQNTFGKFYAEFTAQSTLTTQAGVGFATSGWSFTDVNGIGGGLTSVAWSVTGTVYFNNNSIGTAAAATTSGTVIGMAVDFGNSLVWFSINGGNWNNSGTASPTTGTGGFSFAGIAAGPYYPAFGDGGGSAFIFNQASNSGYIGLVGGF